ncbi:MAG: NBR1-Ig-like domain-containing protein [Candidatus Eisenbacteria bacterium]|nr:NBR1-Ig-like domain-containing protein [Candidatus Eisenbacteria bacterium]
MWRSVLAAAVIALLVSCAPKPSRDAAKPARPADGVKQPPPKVRVAAQPEFAYEILEHNTPLTMTADSVSLVMVKIKNTSNRAWPLAGTIKVGFYWTDDKGAEIEKMNGRALPQKDVPAGQMAYFKARVKAPSTPGTYYLVWDMLEENVAWFSKRGATPVKVAVQVT